MAAGAGEGKNAYIYPLHHFTNGKKPYPGSWLRSNDPGVWGGGWPDAPFDPLRAGRERWQPRRRASSGLLASLKQEFVCQQPYQPGKEPKYDIPGRIYLWEDAWRCVSPDAFENQGGTRGLPHLLLPCTEQGETRMQILIFK